VPSGIGAEVQFLFDDHVLDVERRELRRAGERIALEPQVFDLLVHLVRNRDRVLSKDDLIEAIWDGRAVSESTLTSRINAVRKAVGDSGKAQRLIRTVQRKGIRFVGEVSEAVAPRETAIAAKSEPPRAPALRHEIHFCTASDGVRIAYAEVGTGPPLLKAANWLNHLEYDWESPIWSHLLRELAAEHRLIRYDARGNGLSDWEVDDISFDAFARDLESVVEATGIDRFALLGISQGCAVSIAYAVRHPQRVSHLELYGGFARGRRKRGGRRQIPGILRLGLPIAAMRGLEIGVFVMTGVMMGMIGADALAAHQLVFNVAGVCFMVPLGLAQAATVRVAYQLGRSEPSAARRAAYVALAMGVLFMTAAALLLWTTPRILIGFYLDLGDAANQSTVAIALQLFVIAALFQLFDGVQVIAAGALRGYRDTAVPMLIAAIGYWAIGFAASWLLAFPLGLGAVGLWWGLALGLAVVAISLILRLRFRAGAQIHPIEKPLLAATGLSA